MKDGVFSFKGIEACVVPEGALRAHFVEVDIALENNLRIGRYFELIGFALYQFNGLLLQEAAEHHLVQVRGYREDSAERGGGVGTYRHANGNSSLGVCGTRAAKMLRTVLLRLPVHAGGVLVIDLHPVHADVALPGFRIFGEYERKGDEAPAILRPALQNWK